MCEIVLSIEITQIAKSHIQDSISHYLIQWFIQFEVTLGMGFSSFLFHDTANTKFLFVLGGP